MAWCAIIDQWQAVEGGRFIRASNKYIRISYLNQSNLILCIVSLFTVHTNITKLLFMEKCSYFIQNKSLGY